MGIELEICADSVESCLAAEQGQADRIELCSALALGGVTPSHAFIQWAAKMLTIPVHVLIRPRPYDFYYSKQEVDLMLNDIKFARDSGVAGVVIGALDAANHINYDLLRELIAAAGSLHVTFHRAFDASVGNPIHIIERLHELGIKRLLTSGREMTAVKGAELITCLQENCPVDFTIMAGAGITPENCQSLVEVTGVRAIHSSARSSINMAFDVGSERNLFEENSRKETSNERVRQFRQILSDFK